MYAVVPKQDLNAQGPEFRTRGEAEDVAGEEQLVIYRATPGIEELFLQRLLPFIEGSFHTTVEVDPPQYIPSGKFKGALIGGATALTLTFEKDFEVDLLGVMSLFENGPQSADFNDNDGIDIKGYLQGDEFIHLFLVKS